MSSLFTISMNNVLKDEKPYTRPTGNCTEENKFKDLVLSIKTLGLVSRQNLLGASVS